MTDIHTLPFYRRRWAAMLAAVAVLAAMLLVLLPYGVSYGLHKWLLENGGEDVSIEDVDINLFTGRASIQNMQLYVDGKPLFTIAVLAADLDWRPLFSRRVVLRSVRVDGVELFIEVAADGRLRVGGISPPEGEQGAGAETDKQWQLGVDQLEIANTTINYQAPDLHLLTQLDELTLKGIRTWANDDAPLLFKGAMNGATVVLNGSLPPLSEGFGYRGSVRVSALDLGAFAALAQASVGELAGRLSVDMQLDLLLLADAPLRVTQSGMIRADELRFTQAENRVALGNLQWDGDAAVTAADTPLISANGQLQSGQLAWDVTDNDLQLARIESVQLDRLELQESGELALEGIMVRAVALAQADDPDSHALFSAAAISLDSLQLESGNTVLGKLHGEDVVTLLRREPDGMWEVVKLLESLPFGRTEQVVETVETEAADEPAGQIRLDEVRITGNSTIELQDATVKPAFSTRLSLDQAVAGNLDTAKPEQDSPLTIEAHTGKHSKISVKGTIRPFAERPTLKLENHLEGIALPDISPYTVSTLGYALQSGQLDADSSIRIDAGKLEGDNKLTLRGLEVEPVDNAAREQLDSKLSLPLGTALNMLRDKHGTISLDLPVSGDIDNPDFDISDVVNTAVGKALKKGSMTYLMMALQPYGALITVARLAGEAASNVRLDPVLFDPGSASRREASAGYLGKVAGIMVNRPELNIKVCGVASENDRATLSAQATAAAVAAGKQGDKQAAAKLPEPVAISDKQLLALATERAGVITDYLVSEHAVTASRLVACQPVIDSTVESKPRVDLLI
ncbi:MAG: DUF748 domain-containing protein [Porticoccaceae bacterium]